MVRALIDWMPESKVRGIREAACPRKVPIRSRIFRNKSANPEKTTLKKSTRGMQKSIIGSMPKTAKHIAWKKKSNGAIITNNIAGKKTSIGAMIANNVAGKKRSIGAKRAKAIMPKTNAKAWGLSDVGRTPLLMLNSSYVGATGSPESDSDPGEESISFNTLSLSDISVSGMEYLAKLYRTRSG